MNIRYLALAVGVAVVVIGGIVFALVGGSSPETTASASTTVTSEALEAPSSTSTTSTPHVASSPTTTSETEGTTTTDGPTNTVPPVTDTAPTTTFVGTTTTFVAPTTTFDTTTTTSTPSGGGTTTTTGATTTTTYEQTTTTSVTGSASWPPKPGVTWQWQLDGTIDTSVEADVFDVDLFETPRSVISALRAKGVRTICYLSAGSSENFRPDFDQFPSEVKGKSNGWAGEKWLDIRRLDVLAPIMEARLDLCKSKGFDGVEFDNVDGYANNTGFPLTASDQIAYNKFLAHAAHVRGLSAGLKNDVEQAKALQPFFDFAVNEQCFQYNECDALKSFISAGKAVFHVEYKLSTSQFCSKATDLGFSSMKKKLNLGVWNEPCW